MNVERIRFEFDYLPSFTMDMSGNGSGLGSILKPRILLQLSTGTVVDVNPYGRLLSTSSENLNQPTTLDSIIPVLPLIILGFLALFLLRK